MDRIHGVGKRRTCVVRRHDGKPSLLARWRRADPAGLGIESGLEIGHRSELIRNASRLRRSLHRRRLGKRNEPDPTMARRHSKGS